MLISCVKLDRALYLINCGNHVLSMCTITLKTHRMHAQL